MSTLVKRAARRLSDNSPHILTGLGVAGAVGTAYLAHRVGQEVALEIREAEVSSGLWIKMQAKEKVQRYWKRYIPVALVGATSVFCIISSNVVSTKRNLAFAAAASLSEIALREFQAKTIEVVGPNKDRQIRDAIAQDKVDKDYGEIVIATKEDVACFDTFSGRPFSSTIEKIRRAQNDLNLKVINEFGASHNDFYELLGLEPVRAGEILGWNSDHPMDIVFHALLVKGEPVVAISYRQDPKSGWDSPFG
ncbi:MAG: hypothetical protein BWY50_01865 [Spirochaetes bacterium ADurb.Bin315]|nr:MAG: hypothetical protein BWY50_01865 [Spirochaetes bacterium ADurb.Bin315]